MTQASPLQAEQWLENLFNGDEKLFQRFLDLHSMDGTWTDGYGIMCQVLFTFNSFPKKKRNYVTQVTSHKSGGVHQNDLLQATALVVGRQIQVIGTNHKEQGGEKFSLRTETFI